MTQDEFAITTAVAIVAIIVAFMLIVQLRKIAGFGYGHYESGASCLKPMDSYMTKLMEKGNTSKKTIAQLIQSISFTQYPSNRDAWKPTEDFIYQIRHDDAWHTIKTIYCVPTYGHFGAPYKYHIQTTLSNEILIYSFGEQVEVRRFVRELEW